MEGALAHSTILPLIKHIQGDYKYKILTLQYTECRTTISILLAFLWILVELLSPTKGTESGVLSLYLSPLLAVFSVNSKYPIKLAITRRVTSINTTDS